MRKLMTATALVILLGDSVALAQSSGRARNSTNSGTASQSEAGPAAPVGHKQPRPSDVPSQSAGTKLDDENAALDRKLKSICRGC